MTGKHEKDMGQDMSQDELSQEDIDKMSDSEREAYEKRQSLDESDKQ